MLNHPYFLGVNPLPLSALLHRFLVFLGVYTGVANNPNFSYFIRYNAMQAVLLDILLM